MWNGYNIENLPPFELTNAPALVNSDILLERDAGSICVNNIAHARQDVHFYFPESFSESFFFIKNIFNILLYHKVLNSLAVRISLMTKGVFFNLKKTFSKYKFKRFLSGIDFPKPILQTWCV